MEKFIVVWNCGYGPSAKVVEAESLDEAETLAWENWKEEAEMDADYYAKPYTKEEAEMLGAE
jgi:hypothetical protein